MTSRQPLPLFVDVDHASQDKSRVEVYKIARKSQCSK